MKVILLLFSLLIFIGCLVAYLNLEVSSFWNGFIVGGLIFSPIVFILYAFNIIKTNPHKHD